MCKEGRISRNELFDVINKFTKIQFSTKQKKYITYEEIYNIAIDCKLYQYDDRIFNEKMEMINITPNTLKWKDLVKLIKDHKNHMNITNEYNHMSTYELVLICFANKLYMFEPKLWELIPEKMFEKVIKDSEFFDEEGNFVFDLDF